jgi:hypothetical protein
VWEDNSKGGGGHGEWQKCNETRCLMRERREVMPGYPRLMRERGEVMPGYPRGARGTRICENGGLGLTDGPYWPETCKSPYAVGSPSVRSDGCVPGSGLFPTINTQHTPNYHHRHCSKVLHVYACPRSFICDPQQLAHEKEVLYVRLFARSNQCLSHALAQQVGQFPCSIAFL